MYYTYKGVNDLSFEKYYSVTVLLDLQGHSLANHRHNYRLDCRGSAFLICVAMAWNKLPQYVIGAQSVLKHRISSCWLFLVCSRRIIYWFMYWICSLEYIFPIINARYLHFYLRLVRPQFEILMNFEIMREKVLKNCSDRYSQCCFVVFGRNTSLFD